MIIEEARFASMVECSPLCSSTIAFVYLLSASSSGREKKQFAKVIIQ